MEFVSNVSMWNLLSYNKNKVLQNISTFITIYYIHFIVLPVVFLQKANYY